MASPKYSNKKCSCVCHKRFGQNDELKNCIHISSLGTKETLKENASSSEFDRDSYTEGSIWQDSSHWFLYPYHHCHKQSNQIIKEVDTDQSCQNSDIPIGLEAIVYQNQICRCGFRKNLLKNKLSPFFPRNISLIEPYNGCQWHHSCNNYQNTDNSFSTYSNRKDINCYCTPPSSPYEYKLLLTKLKELKEEEQKLLHMRRTMELSRVRGPLPKWYEGKDKHFHDESHFNTFVLKCPKIWEKFVKVREDTLSCLLSDVNRQYHDGFHRYRLVSRNSV